MSSTAVNNESRDSMVVNRSNSSSSSSNDVAAYWETEFQRRSVVLSSQEVAGLTSLEPLEDMVDEETEEEEEPHIVDHIQEEDEAEEAKAPDFPTKDEKKKVVLTRNEKHQNYKPKAENSTTKKAPVEPSTGTSMPGSFRQIGPDYIPADDDDDDDDKGPERSRPFLMDDLEVGATPLPDVFTNSNAGAGVTAATTTTATTTLHDDNLASTSMTIQAEKVPETQVVEAKKDYSVQKIRFIVLGVFFLVVVFVVVLNIALTRDDDSNKHPIDERCKLPLQEQNVALLCLCGNSTKHIVDQLTVFERSHFDDKVEYLRQVGGLDPNVTYSIEECVPESMAILQLTIQARVEGIDPNDAETHIELMPLVPEGFAILMLYFTLGGLYWDNQDGWLSKNVSLHDFFGIDIFFLGAITQVKLPNNNLSGSIPSSIKFLNSLRELDLSGNPGLTGTLPVELAAMSNLNSLVLYSSGITGSLPDELGLLERLDTIDLHDNILTGSLPDSLFTNNRLRNLDVSVNQLTGSIPESIGHSTRLQSLQLQANQFTGSLPDVMANLKELEELNLGVNSLNGSVPEYMADLPVLNFVSILDSGLSGPLPESYCETVPEPAFENGPPRQRRVVMRCIEDEDGDGGHEVSAAEFNQQAIEPVCSCCANPLAVIVLCAEAFGYEILESLIHNDL